MIGLNLERKLTMKLKIKNKYKKVEYVPVEYPPTSEIMAELKELENQIKTEMDELEALLNG